MTWTILSSVMRRWVGSPASVKALMVQMSSLYTSRVRPHSWTFNQVSHGFLYEALGTLEPPEAAVSVPRLTWSEQKPNVVITR